MDVQFKILKTFKTGWATSDSYVKGGLYGISCVMIEAIVLTS
jgi:hypothetical protein